MLEGDEQAYYYWLFPNFMLNIYLGMLQINIIVPLSHDRTLTIFEWYFSDPGTPETLEHPARLHRPSATRFSRKTSSYARTCGATCKRVIYTQGRYCVKRENGVHHFHGLLAEMVGQ